MTSDAALARAVRVAVVEAIHEASHAVIAEALDIAVVFVTLNPRDDGGRFEHAPTDHAFCRVAFTAHPRYDQRRRLAVQTLAGVAAESVFGFTRTDWRTNPHGTIDRRALRRIPVELDQPDHLWRVALRLVRWHRSEIDVVAGALLDAQTLARPELLGLLHEARPERWGSPASTAS